VHGARLDSSLKGPVERLAVVLGDQLDERSAGLDGLNPARDAVLMMEVKEEATHVPSHRQRTALFLSAMRHFALGLQRKGLRVAYSKLDDPANTQSFDGEVARIVTAAKPQAVQLVQPGEYRVLDAATRWSRDLGVPVRILPDRHFLTAPEEFADWAHGRNQLVMEQFYRAQRKRFDLLIEGGKPMGGTWNYDADNRQRFRKRPQTPPPIQFTPDKITRDVLRIVERTFPDAPGSADHFAWPVTRTQAQAALADFVKHRLQDFGPFQDAMWIDEPFLYHSLLSPALNLKLLDPREVVAAAIEAFHNGDAPIQSVEGFVRQIVGWREFIRGVYWHEGPTYAERNTLGETGNLPNFYWTGETDMVCLQDAVGQVLRHGYGHHIQRLMVTGNFALIAGVHPKTVSDWYLGMYVDAVDWVTLPNTLGMVMHADGGVVGTKPYAASGKYTQRMSNYCKACRYDPAKRTGPDACPVTTFYWDFLIRHQQRFASNPRMGMIFTHVDRMDQTERNGIRTAAEHLRTELGVAA
jgi:deoxyribodipyrimidine photolyase-related protein